MDYAPYIMPNRIQHIANKFIDVKTLFPKSKIDLRKKPTPYQTKKIRAAVREFEKFAGDSRFLEKDFVKVKRTKSALDFMKKAGYPKGARGVLLPGGSEKYKDVKIQKGVLFYERGGLASGVYPLDATSQDTFSMDLQAHRYLISAEGYRAYLQTAGGRLKTGVVKVRGAWLRDPSRTPYSEDGDGFEDFYQSAMGTFEYYAALHQAGGTRTNGRLAAHPSKWGLSVLLEQKPKEPKKTRAKKRTKK
jgi:hypothetical protein